MLAVSSLFRSALQSRDLRFAWLVDLPLGLKWTTHDDDIAIGGEVWESAGGLLSVPESLRTREVRQHGVSLNISAIDATRYALLTAQSIAGQPVRVDLVLLAADGGVIGDERMTMYRGFADRLDYADSRDADVITLHVNGPWYKPSQTAGRQTTDGSQRALYPGDAFFSFAHEKYDNLLWGKED